MVDLTQESTYLGPLQERDHADQQEYFVRAGNRTVYPKKNRSIVLRMWTDSGVEGWGETYGIVSPKTVAEIIQNLFKGFVIGRNPLDVVCIYEDLYDLMRVRAYSGGFYHDALAAVDIALWDIAGKLSQQPLARMLGGIRRQEIPAYVSGLPAATLKERCEIAQQWKSAGFTAFKFALPVANEGAAAEMEGLRNILGEEAQIACDMHWARTRGEAVSLAGEMAPFRPWYLEAPVWSEDIDGLEWINQQATCPIAVGEEWRNIFDARLRIDRGACQIIQPEMGHTGVTQFVRIARYAQAHNLQIIPHATIGSGIFLAAQSAGKRSSAKRSVP